MCTGRMFTMVGEVGEPAFEDRKTNLEQFRSVIHQTLVSFCVLPIATGPIRFRIMDR